MVPLAAVTSLCTILDKGILKFHWICCKLIKVFNIKIIEQENKNFKQNPIFIYGALCNLDYALLGYAVFTVNH